MGGAGATVSVDKDRWLSRYGTAAPRVQRLLDVQLKQLHAAVDEVKIGVSPCAELAGTGLDAGGLALQAASLQRLCHRMESTARTLADDADAKSLIQFPGVVDER